MDHRTENSGLCSIDIHKELLQVLKSQHLSKFINLLKRENVNVNEVLGDPTFGTLLDVCCMEIGFSKFVDVLLSNGADPNIVNSIRKKAPLHFATLTNEKDTVKVLLEHHDIDVNIQDNTGSSALHLAVKDKSPGSAEIVSSLLKHPKINVNIINRKGKTPLHIALAENNKEYIEQLINHPNVDLEITNLSGDTLKELISETFPDLKNQLDSQRSDEKLLSKGEMFNLLRNQQLDLFVKAIKINRDTMEENDGSHTFLQYCSEFGIPSIAQQLLDLGANPNTTNAANLQTPLMIAASKGFVSIVTMLVNNNKTIYSPVNDETVLHCIVKGSCVTKGLGEYDIERNHLKCLQILLNSVPRNKLNINQRDVRGNTALHYAAKQASHDMVLLLLKAGAYIGVRNKNNEPACADILMKTFETHLDSCVYTNKKLPREDSYQIIFNYKCLIPFQTYASTNSNTSLQKMIEIEEDNPVLEMQNCESEPLMYITRNRELRPLLKHPIFTSFLHLKWHKMRPYFYINLLMYFFFCIFFTLYILNVYSNIPLPNRNITLNGSNDGNVDVLKSDRKEKFNVLWLLALVFLVVLMLRELLQLLINPNKYVVNPENWLEIGIMSVAALILFCKSCLSMRHQLSAIGILLSWAELVLLIGRHPSLSTNIEMFKTVSWNFLKFLAWYSLLILAFALSFHSLFKDAPEDDNLFEEPGISVFKTIVMLTGEFEAADLPFGEYPITSHLLFVLFVFLIAIVLFNLLNGLAVSDTQAIKSDAELVGYISRVKLVSYIEYTLTNPMYCTQLSTKAKSIFCCVKKTFCDTKNELFAGKINLFQDMSHNNYEISIFPNLGNRVEIDSDKLKKRKSAWLYENDNVNKNCINDCKLVYMDPDIVKSAKEILIRKTEENELNKKSEIMAEKEKMLTQMLEECKETLNENKKMLKTIMEALATNNMKQ